MKIAMSAMQWWSNRKLVGKYSLMLLGAALLIVPTTQIALEALLRPVFERIEQQGVEDQMARVKHTLGEFETSLQQDTSDYAVWDDMYAYAETGDKSFELETLTPEAYVNNGVDYRGVVRIDGSFVWSSAVDRDAVKELHDESDALKTAISDPLYFDRASNSPKSIAYVNGKRGIYLLASEKIVKSDSSGKQNAMLVTGILLDKKSMTETLQVGVTINRDPNAAIVNTLARSKSHIMSQTEPQKVTTQIGLYDVKKTLLATISFSTPRSITAAGESAILMASAAVILAMFTLIALLGFGIRQITVQRLRVLENYVRNFRTGEQPVDASLTKGSDEIASLSRQFQTLSEQLSEAEDQLRQRSYLQGKADSAAGMLHNVRNALAPVRVVQEKWLREETLPFRANMQKAVDELASPEIAPDRKASLEQFLISAARTIAVSAPGRLIEMEEMKGSVDQISEILSGYNFDTSSTNAGDEIDLRQLLQSQYKTLSAQSNGQVELILPDALPRVLGNRVHLGQVVGNIFVNAHEAMLAANTAPMRLIVTCDDNIDSDLIVLRVTDNGDGIASENIANIFQRGYSTRRHKSGGLGMHWSANAMRAMGGSIALESEGAGKGASAIVTLIRAKAAVESLAA
jgi:signal transduction histidine kinase